MSITIDTNSGEDNVYDSILRQRTENVVVRRERLDVGDILIQVEGLDETVCIERKTWSDMASSIIDGRLQEQKSRMVEPNVIYMYVIESTHLPKWNATHGYMKNTSIWGAILKLQLRDGHRVLHSSSSEDTATIALYIAKQLEAGGFAPKDAPRTISGTTVQKRKRDNMNDPHSALCAMLTVIPGMSPSRAFVVANAFPSVQRLIDAKQSDIAIIKEKSRAIGPKLAASIKHVFSSHPPSEIATEKTDA